MKLQEIQSMMSFLQIVRYVNYGFRNIYNSGRLSLQIRGHSTTTWTEFCHFLTPPPLRGQFLYPERGQKQIFFDPISPLILSTQLLNGPLFVMYFSSVNCIVYLSVYKSFRQALFTFKRLSNSSEYPMEISCSKAEENAPGGSRYAYYNCKHQKKSYTFI